METKLLSSTIEIPQAENETLNLIKEDINKNIASGTPQMVIDRLHTFTTQFFRNICQKHNIAIVDNHGNKYPLHSLVGNLKNWYRDKNYFESEFCIIALQNTINIFDKYNAIRNEQSASHPNEILNKIESEYVVHVVAYTLTFIERIEKYKDNIVEEELPF